MKRTLLVSLLLTWSCTPSKPPDQSDLAQSPADLTLAMNDLQMESPDMRTLGDLLSSYPAPPYGNDVGATAAPLAWEGYVNPTAVGIASTKPYVNYTLDNLRKSGLKYAVLYGADTF